MKNDKRYHVTDAVFEKLKSAIISGEWKPGEKLPSENRLCEMYGVSRISLRTALNRLAVLGLVESKQGGGTYVCEFSGAEHLQSILPVIALEKPDRINMFEFRKIIETESTALAAIRADFLLVQKMRAANQAMKSSSDIHVISKADLEFHYLIAQATHNPLIIRVFEVLSDTYLALLTDNVCKMGATGAADHDKIIAAIETRDSEGAKALMKQHLDDTIKRAVME